MSCKDKNPFFEAFAEHTSARTNLREKWSQFTFAFIGQIRGPLANFIELGVIQLCCGANRARVIRFSNPGKREMEKPSSEYSPKPSTEQAPSLFPVYIYLPNVSVRCARFTGFF